jgi:hypothetical protein
MKTLEECGLPLPADAKAETIRQLNPKAAKAMCIAVAEATVKFIRKGNILDEKVNGNLLDAFVKLYEDQSRIKRTAFQAGIDVFEDGTVFKEIENVVKRSNNPEETRPNDEEPGATGG